MPIGFTESVVEEGVLSGAVCGFSKICSVCPFLGVTSFKTNPLEGRQKP